MEKKLYLQEEKLYAAFKLFDNNDDGCISAEELREVLGSIILGHLILIFSIAEEDYKEKNDDFWNELVKDADLNDDGKVKLLLVRGLIIFQIDYNEFLIMMQNSKMG